MRAAIRSGCAGSYGVDIVKAWTAPGNERFQFRVPARAFVAIDQGRLIGFAGWRTDGGIGGAIGSRTLPRISAVFVAPGFAGRGLGKALARSVEEDICDNGYDAAYLYASLNAVPFYRGLGYREGARKAMAVAEDIYVAVVRMDKNLTEKIRARASV